MIGYDALPSCSWELQMKPANNWRNKKPLRFSAFPLPLTSSALAYPILFSSPHLLHRAGYPLPPSHFTYFLALTIYHYLRVVSWCHLHWGTV